MRAADSNEVAGRRATPPTPTRRARRGRWAVASVVVAAVVAASAWVALRPAGPSTGGSPSASAGAGGAQQWSLVWAEEFDGDQLDTGVWTPYHSTYGHANGELQCHTPDNVVVTDGILRITARRGEVTCSHGKVRRYSSGFVATRETGTYFPRFARFEVRARLPHGQGLWPAFWLRHRDGAAAAEVDVMEYFHSRHPGESTATVHLGGDARTSVRRPFEEPTDEPGWHIWTVDIERTADGVAFTFPAGSGPDADDSSEHRFVAEPADWVEAHPGEGLWDIALNLSIGGRWAGDPDGPLGELAALSTCAQGGVPPECRADDIRRAEFPATFEVDYVRVYERA